MGRVKVSEDVTHFRKWLKEGVILRCGDGSVTVGDDDPVWVAVVVDVQGYGPHEGAIAVDQNRYHATCDTALQSAFELLKGHMTDSDPERVKELMDEYGDEWDSTLTETFDGVFWKLKANEFANAISGTDAEKYISIYHKED